MKRLFGLFILFITATTCGAHPTESDTLKVMWYNVENLFDCQDDTLKDDNQFLPDGEMRWTHNRYLKKLTSLSQVIAAVGNGHLPDVIGMCEVENQNVLFDLIRRSPLKTVGYRFCITQSPDERGINVAFLYRPERFIVIQEEEIVVDSIDKPTRNILHLTGIIPNQDTIDLYLCHFPSRSGGRKKTETYRLRAATLLKRSICHIQETTVQERNIIVMGDFNDFPHNRAIKEIIQAHSPRNNNPILPQHLYNLIYHKEKGSYFYQGNWNKLDHIFVTGNLLDKGNSVYTSEEDTRIVTFPFLLEYHERYGEHIPLRTYLGPSYKGGYSDHLPLQTNLIFRFKK